MSETLSAFDLLDGDVNGYKLRSLTDELLTIKVSVKNAMDAGLGPDEFAVAKRVHSAVETAEETVRKLHDKLVG